MTTNPVTAADLELTVADRAVARYVLRPDVAAVETPKPYLHPLRTLGGSTVTGFRPEDHPWHHGLFFGMPRVGEHNLWGGGTYLGPDRGYEILTDQGRIEHVDLATPATGSAVDHRLRWYGHDGEVLLDEERSLRAGDAGDGWRLGWRSALTNRTASELPLETPAQRGRPDGGYGGLWLRLATGVTFEGTYVDGRPTGESGVAGGSLVAQCRAVDGAPFTVALATGRQWTGGTHWVLRLDDFPALGWGPAYADGLRIAVGGTLVLDHRLVVLDGHPEVAGVIALVAR